MTTTRPKRVTRHVTPAPIVEDDATIIRTCLDRLLYTVDVMARFERTHEDIRAVNSGTSDKTMAQVMTEVRWHEHASKARKECPLGSTKKKRHIEEEEDDEDEEDDPDVPSTSAKIAKTPKPTPEKKSTPSKAKLAAIKKKADAARRKAQREAKKLAEQEEDEEEEQDETMPILENATITEVPTPEDGEADGDRSESSSETMPASVVLTPALLEENENAPLLERVQQFDEQDYVVEPPGRRIQSTFSMPFFAVRKPSIEHDTPVALYPLDFFPVEEDVPGRLWCPPREYCKATDSEVIGIGPLTELETLDLTLQSDSLEYLLPEKADLILTRMLELQIPALELKLLDPEMSDEVRENNIKQLEIYEKQLDECYDKADLWKIRILNLPSTDAPKYPVQNVIPYEELDPTWYSTSRQWSTREKVVQPNYLENIDSIDDEELRNEMIAKAKAAKEEETKEKIQSFQMPLIHDLSDKSPIILERMAIFRLNLATLFQYEDFEKVYMDDPACQDILKTLQPLPYENGTVAEESEEELAALISSYKKRFAEENPMLPLPTDDGDDGESSIQRCLQDVIDTVVLRDITDLPTYPHRIPMLPYDDSIPHSSNFLKDH